MANFITIDGGTTNTRISLVCDGEIADVRKLSIGARAGIDDNTALKTAISDGIKEILSRNSVLPSDVERILASGMITSEFGLCKVDHLMAPAGLKELRDSVFETVLKDVSDIPFVFIRGVRTACTSLEEADMMRGEETELMGIMGENDGECIYVLPGSHSKVIYTDEKGRIIRFSTMLTGEMIASLSQNTILKDAVDLSESQTDDDYLLKGYDYCCVNGLNESLFKVRILKNIFGCTKDETYSFFMGAVLKDEISKIISSSAPKVVIGGRAQIRNTMAKLLWSKSSKEVVCLDDGVVDSSTVDGMLKIYMK